MQLTKQEMEHAKSLLPKELTVIRVQNEKDDYYNIIVGRGLASVFFDYAQTLDEAHAADEETTTDRYIPESGEEWLADIVGSALIWAEGSLEFKRDFVVSPRQTIAYLDHGDITTTQRGVDQWLKREGWLARKEGTRALIERVVPVLED